MKYITTAGDHRFTIQIDEKGEVTVDGEPLTADLAPSLDPTLFSLLVENASHDLRISADGDHYAVQVGGELHEVVVEDERTHRLAGLKGTLAGGEGEAVIKAPMPGVVVELPVGEGDEVVTGSTVVVLESMKMHNEFKSPRDGRVHAVRVKLGDKVDKNAILLTIA